MSIGSHAFFNEKNQKVRQKHNEYEFENLEAL